VHKSDLEKWSAIEDFSIRCYEGYAISHICTEYQLGKPRQRFCEPGEKERKILSNFSIYRTVTAPLFNAIILLNESEEVASVYNTQQGLATVPRNGNPSMSECACSPRNPASLFMRIGCHSPPDKRGTKCRACETPWRHHLGREQHPIPEAQTGLQ
jgi:hypothetical protein